MKPIQESIMKPDKSVVSTRRVRLTVVSDEERQVARIPAYAYILP